MPTPTKRTSGSSLETVKRLPVTVAWRTPARLTAVRLSTTAPITRGRGPAAPAAGREAAPPRAGHQSARDGGLGRRPEEPQIADQEIAIGREGGHPRDPQHPPDFESRQGPQGPVGVQTGDDRRGA